MIGKISVKCGLVNAYSFCENKKIGCDPPGVCVNFQVSKQESRADRKMNANAK